MVIPSIKPQAALLTRLTEFFQLPGIDKVIFVCFDNDNWDISRNCRTNPQTYCLLLHLMYAKLRQIYTEIKSHTDLTPKSIPFFKERIREIRVELLKVSAEQGEQLSRDVTDAIRHIIITEREDLNMIPNYPKEIPKYLARVRDTVITYLAFTDKKGR